MEGGEGEIGGEAVDQFLAGMYHYQKKRNVVITLANIKSVQSLGAHRIRSGADR